MESQPVINEDKSLKRSVLLVATFAAFLTPFLGSAVNLALPAIGKEFNANAISLSWVISSFILASAIFLLPFGRLGDIIGRKKVFTYGIILFTISTFLIIFSKSNSTLIVLRIFQGFSSAMIFGTSLAIITSVFPPGERGHTMALLSPLAGKLSDRKNPGVIASAGMGMTGLGLLLLCFISASTPVYVIILLLILMGVGFGLFSSPNSNAIMSSVEKKHLGIASGIVGTMRMVGQMMSMGIAMMLIALFIGKQTINPVTYPGLMSALRTGFIVFSILSILGIFASLARNEKLNRK